MRIYPCIHDAVFINNYKNMKIENNSYNILEKYKQPAYIILLIIITLITFCNSFYHDFAWEDERDIINNPYIRNLSAENLNHILFQKFDMSIYQPVSALTSLIAYQLWGLNPMYYHICNVIIYIINIILIYFFILSITKSREKSFITSLFFSLHPIHSEVVSAIFGNCYIYSFIFLMMSFLCFSKYIRSEEKKIFYILSVLLYFISIMTKEYGLVLFPLFILYDFSFVHELNLKNISKRYKLYIPFIIISIFSLYIFMHFTTRVKSISGLSRFFHFLMDIEIFTVFYLRNLIYPVGLNPMYNIKGLYLSYLVLSICVFLLIILSLIITWKRTKDIFYFIMWLIIALIPYTHFILPVTYVAADRYIYVASLSFCFFLSLLIIKIYNFKGERIYKIISVSFFIIITIWYMTVTISQNRIWKNSTVLWTYVTELDSTYKDNGLSLTFMGDTYLKANDMDNAIKYYEKALYYNENNADVVLSLGIACMAKGDYNKAIDNLEKAKKMNPSNILIYNNLAIIYIQKGLYNKAAEEYRTSLEIDPKQAEVRQNLNILLKQLNN